MRATGNLPLRIIDLLGGCTVAACALGFVWLIVIGNNRTSGEINELLLGVNTARRDVRVLLAAREKQRAILASRRAELAESGQLPAQAPIEEYFQTLSTIASKNRLRVIRHHPLSPRRYPGLLEQRYAYEVAGSTLDLVRFLKAIEETDFWADVSYLTIEQGAGLGRAASRRAGISPGESRPAVIRHASLTISVFSAPPEEPS